ncbi:hypothetical protein QVD17_16003 [Tagetes erecta]|uniref:Uncharacterized protein n=1 Tax=Tagetes erecta TaxID=13708 RepID=A0AAD8NT51_TARER|nr:hypothetical protein QVD17_16003 [Tagetes erecta]
MSISQVSQFRRTPWGETILWRGNTDVLPHRQLTYKSPCCLAAPTPPPSPSRLSVPSSNNEVIRPFRSISPSVWGYQFLNYDEKTELGEVEKIIQDLREQVRNDIEVALGNPKEHTHLLKKIDNGGHPSLWFRLLRQQGFYVSCDIFNQYKNEQGVFKEFFNNVEELLELYEVTWLRVQGEVVLDDALEFTRTRLAKIAKDPSNSTLSTHIQEALETPLHKRIPIQDALSYIRFYEKQPSHDESLLKLAKLGFNLLQSLHKSELSQVSKWWQDIGVVKNLPYVRDRIVENYFGAVAVCPEPKYSHARVFLAKVTQMITVLDDTYDAYGSFEELEIFTEAVERWCPTCLDMLPGYMRLVYQVLLDLYQEMEPIMEREEIAPLFNHAKECMKELIKGYMLEAKCVNVRHIPTTDEYASIAFVTIGGHVEISSCYLGIADIFTNKSLKWALTKPPLFKASCVIARLLNDLAGYKKDQEREDFPSIVECYMKQYDVTEEYALDLVRKNIEDTWKDINRESLMCKGVPRPLIMVVINFVRLMEYGCKQHYDKYTEVGEDVRDDIKSLFVHALSM